MIDLLLKSGAQASARTLKGWTALDLARKYKHTHLLASLEQRRGREVVPDSVRYLIWLVEFCC